MFILIIFLKILERTSKCHLADISLSKCLKRDEEISSKLKYEFYTLDMYVIFPSMF